MKPETSSKKTYSKTRNLQELFNFTALVFLKINRFLDTIDKLYISNVFAICRCKPLQAPNNGKQHHKFVPRNTPNSNKIHARKNYEFWHRFWHDFDFKNDPTMIPKSPKITPLGFQGPPWDPLGEPGGPPGASRPTFGSNLAPQMIPK